MPRWMNCTVRLFSNRLRQNGSSVGQAARDERAVHQRPGVVAEAGIEAGDEGAGRDLEEDQDAAGWPPASASRPTASRG